MQLSLFDAGAMRLCAVGIRGLASAPALALALALLLGPATWLCCLAGRYMPSFCVCAMRLLQCSCRYATQALCALMRRRYAALTQIL